MNKSRVVLASYVGVLAYSALIFLGAWRLRYWQALLYVAVALMGVTLSHVLVRRGSDVTLARAARAAAGEAWDKRILAALFFVTAAMFVVAGLDSGRFRWSGQVPVGVTAGGVALMLAGQLLFALAKRENDCFFSTAMIRPEPSHRVCETGPYRIVRHPGYLGMLLSTLAFPLVLQSYWAFVPATAAAVLLFVRTALEDRFLTERLAGYREYSLRTRWRLLPGIF